MRFFIASMVTVLVLSACVGSNKEVQSDVRKTHESILEHSPSGAMIKILDDIPLGDARNVIDFVYNDIQSSKLDINGEFTSIYSVSHWPANLYPRPYCKYIVTFMYPTTPSSGDTLCIEIQSSQFTTKGAEHWVD